MSEISITYYTWVPPFNKIDISSVEKWMDNDDVQFIDLIHKESYRGYYYGYFHKVGNKNWEVPGSKFYDLALKILYNNKEYKTITEANIIRESLALYVSDYIRKRFLKILKFFGYRYMMFECSIHSIPYNFDKLFEKRLKKITIEDTPADFKSLVRWIVKNDLKNEK